MGKSLEEMCRLVTGRGTWHIGDIHVSEYVHRKMGQRIMTVMKQPVFQQQAVQRVPGIKN